MPFASGEYLRTDRLRTRDDGAALLAGPELLVAVKALVHARDRVAAVIADLDRNFMDRCAAAGAAPEKPVPLAGAPLALDHDDPGVFGHSRRVRHAAGTEQELAGADERHLLLPFRRQVVEPLLARELERDLVARVDVKIGPHFAPAAQKGDRLGVLPQHPAPLARGAHALHRVLNIDGAEILHASPCS